MKNREIIAHLNGLNEMTADQEKLVKSNPEQVRIPSVVIFAITSNKNVLIKKYEDYMEAFKELNKQYNVTVEVNGRVDLAELTPDERDKYIEELNNLQEIDVDVKIRKISDKDFGEYTPLLKELDILSFMLDLE